MKNETKEQLRDIGKEVGKEVVSRGLDALIQWFKERKPLRTWLAKRRAKRT